MKLLLDTSALAKRYKYEPGHERVSQLLSEADAVVAAAHCKVEVASSFCRELHDGAITQDMFDQMMANVDLDFADFGVRALSAQIEARAIGAMQRVRLRGMDALHIGTAQDAGVDLFVTADRKQAQAAKSLGLKTELIEA
jgi:predicted nucleic acid-binding protein